MHLSHLYQNIVMSMHLAVLSRERVPLRLEGYIGIIRGFL